MRKRQDVGVVLDFDGTLTSITKPLIMLVDKKASPLAARPELDAMRERFHDKLHAGNLSTRNEREWFVRTIELYAEYRMPIDDAYAAVADVPVKKCVGAFLKRMHDIGVPVAIVSFGVAEFIDRVLELNGGLGRYVDRVYATRLTVDQATGLVVGYDPDSVVVPADKGKWSRKFAAEMGIPKENLIAVGDSYGDRHLGSRKELRLGLASDASRVAHLKDFMGHVIVSDDCFCDAAKWIDAKIKELAGS